MPVQTDYLMVAWWLGCCAVAYFLGRTLARWNYARCERRIEELTREHLAKRDAREGE